MRNEVDISVDKD